MVKQNIVMKPYHLVDCCDVINTRKFALQKCDEYFFHSIKRYCLFKVLCCRIPGQNLMVRRKRWWQH